MNEHKDIWKVSESKKKEILEDLENNASTGTYILAWVLMFGSSNLMTLGVSMFLLEYVQDSIMSITSFVWCVVVANTLFLYTNSYVIYVKIFTKLIIEKVHKFLLWLGTIFALAGIGNIGTVIREGGLDPGPFVLFLIFFWILFLFVFKKYADLKK